MNNISGLWYVYILHFNQPYHRANHYLGITNNITKRITKHKAGCGAKLLKKLKEHNITFQYCVIETYPNYSEAKTREKYLKNKIKNTKRYCLICKTLKGV